MRPQGNAIPFPKKMSEVKQHQLYDHPELGQLWLNRRFDFLFGVILQNSQEVLLKDEGTIIAYQGKVSIDSHYGQVRFTGSNAGLLNYVDLRTNGHHLWSPEDVRLRHIGPFDQKNPLKEENLKGLPSKQLS